ncbi:hypothetical protein AMAG_11584 [Allomyces macrogynus ATCC 38327]|uniref:Fatty acid desaturase domain-containing protein n=1 Tax=Allomyces macrogynus (strain ATCC 38327) TaxID=578462 RepID=A0A0L0SVA5_ALLM3|nr:hypothetical protein AMAG_11584 [Allomyces macrogynus ATCC 38327]|eukprot:KNE66447.1 hypothetical protein AMAG_11584 [Allomyces macrogynus ATCC 38327]
MSTHLTTRDTVTENDACLRRRSDAAVAKDPTRLLQDHVSSTNPLQDDKPATPSAAATSKSARTGNAQFTSPPINAAAIHAHVAQYAHAHTPTALAWLLPTILAFLLLHTVFANVWSLLPLAALIRVRLFILAHDLAHGAFLPSPKWNRRLAAVLMPACAYTPVSFWTRTHGYHHRHVGDLDFPDTAWTTARYRAAPKVDRVVYRVLSHPALILSGVVPAVLFFGVQQVTALGWEWAIEVVVLGWHWYRGTVGFEIASATIAATIGVLLFHAQHTFDGVHRARGKEWDPTAMALRGSSFLQVPYGWRWVTAALEFHHVHHLNAKVPCYRLQACHEDAGEWFDEVPKITVWEVITSVKWCLWDEKRGMVATPDEAMRGGRKGSGDGSEFAQLALFAE